MAETPETQSVELSISTIVQDDRFQIRQIVDPRIVQRYANVLRAGVTMPPVKVANVEGVMILVDGFHRVAAMQLIDRSKVRAEIIDASSKQEARWLAGKANLTHGLQLKSREVRAVFKAYVKADKYMDGRSELKSYRKISEELSGRVHYTTVRAWMVDDFPKVAARMAGLESRAKGGTRKRDQRWKEAMLRDLNNARAKFEGIKTPSDRGDVIAHVENMLQEMRGSGGWEVSDF
jgi:hypothetical protein